MSKVSEFHKAAYDHHDKMAMAHKAMMGHHEEGTAHHAFHKDAHESHTGIRDYHKCAMEKSATDSMNKGTVPVALEEVVRATFLKMFGDSIMPTGVSAVAPTRPGITAVPRGGQPAELAKANVDERFAHLVKVEEEEPNQGVM